MAINTIASIITGNVPALMSYMVEDPVEKTAFFESGVFVQSDIANAIANGPSNIANIPYWKSIDSSIEPNYSDDVYEDVAVPRAITTGEMTARMAYLNEGFGQADLTVELTNKNPLQSVASRLDNFWVRQAERRAAATAIGIYNDNIGTTDAFHTQNDMVVTVTGDITAEAILDAEATMGDDLQDVQSGVIYMHTFVYNQLRKQNLIDFVQNSDQKVNIPVYQGKRVIYADNAPMFGSGGSRTFLTIIFKAGAFAYGTGSPEVPLATERSEDRANGGGVSVLWTRKTWLMHPLGYTFKSVTITGNGTETTPRSASWSDLALATNWDRVMDRKHVPIAFVLSGITA